MLAVAIDGDGAAARGGGCDGEGEDIEVVAATAEGGEDDGTGGTCAVRQDGEGEEKGKEEEEVLRAHHRCELSLCHR